MLVTTPETFDDSEAVCQGMGSDLLYGRTQEEMQLLAQLSGLAAGQILWTGRKI